MLTTLKYPKLNQHIIIIKENAELNKFTYLVEFTNFDNIYSLKFLNLKINNIDYNSVQIFINDKNEYYLHFNNINGNEFIINDTAIYNETFDNFTYDDNIVLSVAQLKKTLEIGYSDELDINGNTIKKGNSSLLSGKQKTKVDLLKINQLHSETININKIVNTKIANINIPMFIDVTNIKSINTFSHIFIITGKTFNCKIKITLNNLTNWNDNIYEIKVLEFSTINELKNLILILNLSKRKWNNNPNLQFLTIDVKFDTSKILNLSNILIEELKIINEATNKTDIFVNNSLSETNGIDINYINSENQVSNDFIIDSNIYKYTNNEIFYVNPNINNNITDNSNLNNYIIPGNFYTKFGQNINSIQNKPINSNLIFNLEVIDFNFENINNEKHLLQRYSVFLLIPGSIDKFELVIFERVTTIINGLLNFSIWVQTGKKIHTHEASEINENDTKKFVSQNDIDNWNTLLNNPNNWKASVNTPLDLLQIYGNASSGWSSYVLSTNSIWSYNGTNWIEQTQIVSENNKGLVSIEQYNDYFLGAGFTRKIPNKNSYISRLTNFWGDFYNPDYSLIQDNVFDEVTRITQITSQIKNYNYQKGWNVNVFGAESFFIGKDSNSIYDFNLGIGVGLEFTNDRQIIFGQYNLQNINKRFIIGNGISDTQRNNLFSISIDGIVEANGYSVLNATSTELLKADGDKIDYQDLPIENTNRIIEITLAELGLTSFDNVTELLVEQYIDSQSFVQLQNEIIYFNIVQFSTEINFHIKALNFANYGIENKTDFISYLSNSFNTYISVENFSLINNELKCALHTDLTEIYFNDLDITEIIDFSGILTNFSILDLSNNKLKFNDFQKINESITSNLTQQTNPDTVYLQNNNENSVGSDLYNTLISLGYSVIT